MTSSMSTQIVRRSPRGPLWCAGFMNAAPQRRTAHPPAAQSRGVSRRGSQNRMRPQVSQVKIWSSCSRPVRSFQRCGRTIIWQAEHLWSMASERPLPFDFALGFDGGGRGGVGFGGGFLGGLEGLVALERVELFVFELADGGLGQVDLV